MKKTKRRRLKKSIKNFIFYTLTSIIIVIGSIIIIGAIKNEQQAYEKARQEEQQAYANCIRDQDQKNGYIIRSACSNNWQELDVRTHAKYKQIKKDLYLISID